MAKILILNGSPRAPKSNSKRYAEIFSKHCKAMTEYHAITKNNHQQLCSKMDDFSDMLFVFPLYADAIPVTLLNFLKTLEQHPPKRKLTISVIINCGFLEPQQNDVAVKMLQFFCKQNHFHWGSVLKIGSGEAMLDSPFQILVTRKLIKLSKSIVNKKYQTFQTTMPLPKTWFVKASTKYWTDYGKKFGTSKAEMQTMEIER